MTLTQIHRTVTRRGKRLSRQALHYHLRALGIKALGVARPAIYPDDSANRVLTRLGFLKPRRNGQPRHRR